MPAAQRRVTMRPGVRLVVDLLGDKWTVPIIGTVSQVLKIGKQPISIGVAGKYYADSPRYGPDLGVRFIVTLLYPTARPKPGTPETYSKDK